MGGGIPGTSGILGTPSSRQHVGVENLEKNFLPLSYAHITHSSTTAVSAIKIFFLRGEITSPHPLAVADCRKALHCQAAHKAAIALVIMGPYDYKLPPSAFVWSKAHIAQCFLSINNKMTLNRQQTCKCPVCWHQILLAKAGAEHAVPINCLEKTFYHCPMLHITHSSTTAVSAIKIFFLRKEITSPLSFG